MSITISELSNMAEISDFRLSKSANILVISFSLLLFFSTCLGFAFSTVSIGGAPRAIGYNPFNNDIYIVNENTNDVSVINSSDNQVKKLINVGEWPVDVEYNPSNNNMYVANRYSGTVSV